MLDTNVFSRLALDPDAQTAIRARVSAFDLEILVPIKVVDELSAGPFLGLPSWFPVRQVEDAVAVADHAFADLVFAGEDKIYETHLGESTKHADAIVAEDAEGWADVLVTGDVRLRTRLKQIGRRCFAWSYEDFRAWLDSKDSTR